MSALLVGYARCSTDQQDLTAQRDALLGLGVDAERIYDPTEPWGGCCSTSWPWWLSSSQT
jgi:hypothetical protein